MKHLHFSVLFVLTWCLLALVALALHCRDLSEESKDESSKSPVFNSEEFREIRQEWERHWYLDEPSRLSPQRVRGGVI